MDEENEVMMITTEGVVIRMGVDGISMLGQNVDLGVSFMNLDDNVIVASLAKVRDEEVDKRAKLQKKKQNKD